MVISVVDKSVLPSQFFSGEGVHQNLPVSRRVLENHCHAVYEMCCAIICLERHEFCFRRSADRSTGRTQQTTCLVDCLSGTKGRNTGREPQTGAAVVHNHSNAVLCIETHDDISAVDRDLINGLDEPHMSSAGDSINAIGV
jgi:hypothetical protein